MGLALSFMLGVALFFQSTKQGLHRGIPDLAILGQLFEDLHQRLRGAIEGGD